MSYPVTYYCPACGRLVELKREGYLSDKAVTPYPFEGWEYVSPDERFEDGAADGVRFVCGDHPTPELPADAAGDSDESVVAGADADAESDDDGCGESFYLSFVRYEDGEEVDPRRLDADGETVELAEGRGPKGPSGPDGPSGPSSDFY
ncbi:hypothetical protein Hbl1158_08550 [Halobaculum sp. CBA1158]|uniref:hypothetical protein n=1 Tax=Halobaculum sp. CBA1158 TaxID=2904243 RepID=UPI001F3DBBBD|nr:hypothetical protein [Halobaculum sp. CBA1158]UIO98607.1 hypothetical protein Hbl1158_08550 [Halobaculum sp. CBA1158]